MPDQQKKPASAEPPRDSLGGCLALKLGRVQAYTAGLNFYSVLTDQGPVTASTLSESGHRTLGTHGASQIPVGAFVLLAGQFRLATNQTCIIVGVVRSTGASQDTFPADMDVLIPNVGWVWDRLHNYLALTEPERIGLQNFNDGTPLDALPGEWGRYNPFGPGIHLGNFLAFLRANERCGIWMFPLDEFMRLAARSVSLHTLGRQYDEEVDEGAEINLIDQTAFLPWEAQGRAQTGKPSGVATDEPQDDPEKPPTKPPVDLPEAQTDAEGIFRTLHLRGYLADLEQYFVSLPDLDDPSLRQLQNAEADARRTAGLFHQARAADGSYSVRSAKSLTFEKYSLIPVPHRKADQHDPAGATPQNSRFNGTFGSGEQKQRQDYLFGGVDQQTPAGRSTLGLELHGFAAKQQLQNLRQRADWVVPEEAQTRLGQELGQGTYPGFKLDPTKSWMALPKYHELKVQSDRWEGVRYYASRSVIEQLDDGSVIIEDGYGSQIIMSGGNIFQTAPNDIHQAPGRHLVQLVPEDLVQRVGGSADLTTSRGDIRQKAERNLMFLSANGGEGGMVFESRAVEAGLTSDPGIDSDYRGIVFRADQAAICHMAKDLYFHTLAGPGIPDVDGDEGGKIVFRAAGKILGIGQSAFFSLADDLTIGIGDSSQDLSITDPSALSIYRLAADELVIGAGRQIDRVVVRTGTYSPSGTSISGLLLEGSFVWNGSGLWNCSITADISMDFRGGFRSKDGGFGELSDAEDQQIQQQLLAYTDSLAIYTSESLQQQTESLADYQAPLQADRYLINRDTVQTEVYFSLRTEADLRLIDDQTFQIPQWRWQQYAAAGGSAKLWEEPQVAYPPTEEQLLPWPGSTVWSDREAHLVLEQPRFFDGTAVSGLDENSTPLARKVLSDSYLVNTF